MGSEASSIGVRTIDHITIVVADLERSAHFYIDVLGMTPVQRPAFPFPGRWFQAGHTLIHLNIAGPEAGAPGLADQRASVVSRGFHYAFCVEDCDQAAERLNQLGIPILDGPRNRPDGARQMYVRDPDGHLIEICTPPA